MKSYRVQECIKSIKHASMEAIDDFYVFKDHVNALQATASKYTHYEKLDEWSHAVYDFVHKMLKKYKFVNGDVEANKKNPDATFWWDVYAMIGSVIYSPHLKSVTAAHHSSAAERNAALLLEIEDVLK